MKPTSLLLSFTILLTLAIIKDSLGQTDSLIVEKIRPGGTSKFKLGSTRLSTKELNQLYLKYSDAHYEFTKAKRNKTASTIMTVSGAIIFSIFVTKARTMLDYQPVPIYSGIGLVCASIPLNFAYNKRARKAMNIYNSRLKQ